MTKPSLSPSPFALHPHPHPILGVLPPSKEYLNHAAEHTASVHLLHLYRLEKKILAEKTMREFLGEEVCN